MCSQVSSVLPKDAKNTGELPVFLNQELAPESQDYQVF